MHNHEARPFFFEGDIGTCNSNACRKANYQVIEQYMTTSNKNESIVDGGVAGIGNEATDDADMCWHC